MKIFSILVLLFPLVFTSCSKQESGEPERVVYRKFASFIFVGVVNKKPGLYKYNVADSSCSEFWNSSKEEVVELSYSNNYSSAFFLTASKTGKEGIFPFIKDAKLYVVPDTSSKPKFIQDIGNGLQVFSRWESGIVFRIVINTLDKKVSTFINQTTIIFNIYGRVLQEETKVYDLTKDGYPRLPKTKPELHSPSGKYQISFNDEKPDSIFLTRTKDKSSVFISTVDKPLNEIRWSDDRNYIFISTLDITRENRTIFTRKPNTSSLYIYSIARKRLVNEFRF